MDIKQITKNLLEVPREDVNFEFIRKQISVVGAKAYMVQTLPTGLSFIRARVSEKKSPFSSDSELSFKPSHLNHTFQRASTPEQTMFYGCFQADDNQLVARATAMLESSNWLRKKDHTSMGRQKITYGRWDIVENINLLPIFHPLTTLNTPYNKHLNDMYIKCIEDQGITNTQLIEDSLQFIYFLANEFGRVVTNEKDYWISALFTESAVRKSNIDGILYPSVQAKFRGYNVALEPKAMEKLELRAVGENMIYKVRENLMLGNGDITKYSQSDSHLSTFELEEYIEDPELIQSICQEYGLRSIDELPLMN